MRVVILGATGFLGRSIAGALTAAGHQVTGVSRSGRPIPEAPGAAVVALDVIAAGDSDLDAALRGADALVYALGPDDRERVPPPAENYFQHRLVAPTVQVARAAARSGVGHLVILGSYYATFARRHPAWQLPQRHPYIRARLDQARRATEAAGPAATTVLEIPLVFGTLPGLTPEWLSYLVTPMRLFPLGVAPAGRSAATTHEDVAAATLAAIEGRVGPGCLPVVTDNFSYAELTRLVGRGLGRLRVPVITAPAALLGAGMRAEGWRLRLAGKDSGLTPKWLAGDLLARDLSLDPARHAPALGLTPRPLDQVVIDTVAATAAAPT